MFCPEVNIRALQKILSINISIYFSKLPIFAAFKSLMTNPGAVRPRFWKSPPRNNCTVCVMRPKNNKIAHEAFTI